MALGQSGRAQEALNCFDQALQLNPRDAGAWLNKAWILAQSFRRYREALECCERARELGHPRAAEAIANCQRFLKS
jgi:tetratricopeptide (TPR) repeat protein